MKKIGITGGIGSGKTVATKLFSLLGVPVYNADERAKWLINNDAGIISRLKKIFGDEAYNTTGELNRPYISKLVFNNKDSLEQLNQATHPAVFADFETWCNQQSAPYIIKEAALIYETILYQQLDKIIVVTAPEKIKTERIIKRDGLTADEVQQRMKNQLPEEEKLNRADYILYNDEEQLLIPQVVQLHQLLTTLQ